VFQRDDRDAFKRTHGSIPHRTVFPHPITTQDSGSSLRHRYAALR
jgi:hypothetical protein